MPRRLLLFLCIGCSLLAQVARAEPSSARASGDAGGWVATDLGNLGRSRVTVADINDRGQVVGEGVTRHGALRGFIWQNGSMTALGHGPFAGAQAINERAQIIGTSSSSSFADEHAVLWETGRMIDLLPRGGVTAVNERGQILGARYPTANGLYSTPVIWEHGKIRNLLPGGIAWALNNRGQVVGDTTGGRMGRATVWQNGKVTDLGPGVPIDINDRGQVVGYSSPVGVVHAVLWQNGKVTDLGPGEAVAINERGQVIGFRDGPGCGWRCARAFLWQNGTRTDLGTLGGRWSFPTAISNRGQIVGYSLDRGGVQHAFLWQKGTMIGLPSPKGNARTRAVAINERNQIIGDDCSRDCGSRAPSDRSKFGVIWTLHGG